MANANQKSNTFIRQSPFLISKNVDKQIGLRQNQVRRICHADLGLVQLALSLVS